MIASPEEVHIFSSQKLSQEGKQEPSRLSVFKPNFAAKNLEFNSSNQNYLAVIGDKQV